MTPPTRERDPFDVVLEHLERLDKKLDKIIELGDKLIENGDSNGCGHS